MNISLGKFFEERARKLAKWRGIKSISGYLRFLISEDEHNNYEGSKDASTEDVAKILQRSRKRE